MTWETVENVKPNYSTSTKVPAMGLSIGVRRCGRKDKQSVYIAVQIGTELAKKAAFLQETVKCRLLTGGGSDAGLIKIQVDQVAGDFVAKRNAKGGYLISIRYDTADGLFSLSFPKFSVQKAEIIRPENGQPVFFTFRPDPSFFGVDA